MASSADLVQVVHVVFAVLLPVASVLLSGGARVVEQHFAKNARSFGVSDVGQDYRDGVNVPDLTLVDAEETVRLLPGGRAADRSTKCGGLPRAWLFVTIGLIECTGRSANLAGMLTANGTGEHHALLEPTLLLAVWTYATLVPLLRPPRTAPLCLLSVYVWSAMAVAFDAIASAPAALAHGALCVLGVALVWGMPVSPGAAHATLEDNMTLGKWATFAWLGPLMHGALDEADVWPLGRAMSSARLMAGFSATNKQGSGIITRLLRAHAHDLGLVFLLESLKAVLVFSQPYFLSKILADISAAAEAQAVMITPGDAKPYSARQLALLYTALAFVAQVVTGLVDLQASFIRRRAAVSAESTLVSTIYEKTLKRIDKSGAVSNAPKVNSDDAPPAASADIGKITSLVSVDAAQVNSFMDMFASLVQAPLAVGIAAAFLYDLLGYSGFVGYIVVLLTVPVNSLLMRRYFRRLQAVLEIRDQRMRGVNELIHAIKYIKLAAWEERWSARLLALRETELAQLLRLKLSMYAVDVQWDIAPLATASLSIAWFALVARGDLTVAVAFPALLTFDILSMQLTMLPMAMSFVVRFYGSMQRISGLLAEEDVPPWVSSLQRSPPLEAFDNRIGAERATFRWHTLETSPTTTQRRWLSFPWKKSAARDVFPLGLSDAPGRAPFELVNISVEFPRGQLSVIYGATASGKSSLLAALLGEMRCTKGRVFLPKSEAHVDYASGMVESVSFCSQHPWLEHATIRANMLADRFARLTLTLCSLFGTPYDNERYNEVLHACALVQDINTFEDRDYTEIGEKGISLSGGQKTRVALGGCRSTYQRRVLTRCGTARAVYAHTQTVLLDDVLSAVDTHTAAILVQRCLRGPLMRGRTIVLVTHHVEAVLESCAWAVRLENGCIAAQGTAADMRARGELAALSSVHAAFQPPSDTQEAGVVASGVDAKKLVERENQYSGNVCISVYMAYIRASGPWIVAIVLAALTLRQSSTYVQTIWIRVWSESYEVALDGSNKRWNPLHLAPAYDDVTPYLLGFLCIQLFTALIHIFADFANIWSTQRASRVLYRDMLQAIVRAPCRWFDRTPSGRILNRFSKDIDGIDMDLSHPVKQVVRLSLAFMIAIATIAYGIPVFLIFAGLLGYLHWHVARWYIAASRDLNRITSNLRSRLIAGFSELVAGVGTVRAFGAERRFMAGMYAQLDRVQAAAYYKGMTRIWLMIRFSTFGAFTFLGATIFALSAGLSAGMAAIVITQAQSILQTLSWGVNMYSSVEQSFNAVERVSEYVELPPEPPLIEEQRPPAAWPSSTAGITFNDVVIKYAPDLDAVLKSVSFEIKPNEKIGLVGRTGSGKSTLAQSLFRFVDPDQGAIFIDGLDITSIGVQDLRSRLTLIPQDAVLFAGSMRDNLDPFSEYTDAECLEVLRNVQLLEPSTVSNGAFASSASNLRGSSPPFVDSAVATTTGSSRQVVNLSSEVSEGGQNWSAGQRQLIAIARALLRQTNIVVLDESTAAVDFETDRKIQSVIREGFRDKIVVTIAHRLQTIIDCDRIMVLDQGQVVEFDKPACLMAKENGVFRQMCWKSDNFVALLEAASERHHVES